jgi:hypothetical protein
MPGTTMPFSPELDTLKAQIQQVILRESEDFFDEPDDLITLQVTVRIACEFFDFLRRTNSKPELAEAEYMAQTIRSGMDQFYVMAHWGNILTGLQLRKGFSESLPSTLRTLWESYDSTFQRLCRTDSSATAFGLLLSLVQMMLFYLAAQFPSFISFSPSDGAS